MNYEKHSLSAEERDFLLNLQKEMNTQDTCCTRDPRYWVIREPFYIYGKELDNPDGIAVFEKDTQFKIFSEELGVESVQMLVKNLLSALEKNDHAIEEGLQDDLLRVVTIDQLREVIREIPDNKIFFREFSVVETESGIFFTRKAALEHLKKYPYHFSSDAHVFGRTALENPEEQLWDILHKVQF